jgi:hypothetical protein
MIQWVFLERNGLLMLRVKLSYHHETKWTELYCHHWTRKSVIVKQSSKLRLSD